ncbi:ubiquitin family domain-containing protein [Phthorimaea operculella]|nr:ubiquitin family domain-containing protein [Phthorimaea operculella]
MKITVKKLQGGECNLDVSPSTSIADIKRQIAAQLKIPAEDQKLLLLGRTLADEQTVESYPTIKEGTKLNLVVKKPESLFEAATRHFKTVGMTEKEATDAANKFLKIVETKIYQMSWDDIDRLCYNCLLEENGEKPVAIEQDQECDDTFGL